MARYLLLMYNKKMEMPEKPTKKQMEEGTRPWKEYLKPLSKAGKLEGAAPVRWEGKTLTADGVSDYNAQNIDLGGYIIIKANSMDEAIEVAKRSPHYASNMGPTTIREIVEIGI